MAKELKFVLLLDCYGELLTEKQREYAELYYCEDLSLSEISQPHGITRQAVRDVIKRTEQILIEIEEKLHFAEKISKMRECFEEIQTLANNSKDSTLSNEIELCVSKGLLLL